MAEVRCYFEYGKNYFAERVELWPDTGKPEIEIFTFETLEELQFFERWLDSTIDMITKTDHQAEKKAARRRESRGDRSRAS